MAEEHHTQSSVPISHTLKTHQNLRSVCFL